MMHFDLRTPCKFCPFRSDVAPYIRHDRAREIADGLRHGDTFTCHKTTVEDDTDPDEVEMVDGDNAQMCAGAMITMEKEGFANQAMRIAERLRMYKAEKVDLAAPVYGSLAEWVESYA